MHLCHREISSIAQWSLPIFMIRIPDILISRLAGPLAPADIRRTAFFHIPPTYRQN
jgi:hypothetical protein